MIYRHTEEEIQYYFSAPALNQSAIKVIIKDGIQKFRELEEQLVTQEDLYYEEKQHFTVGNAVDHILSQGMDSFNNRYAYSVLTRKPSDTVMSIIKMVFDRVATSNSPELVCNNLVDFKEEMYNACNAHDYYMKRSKPLWTEDTRMDSILKDGTAQTYWEELVNSIGKQLLSQNEKEKVLGIANSMLGHKHTAHLFKDSRDFDIIYQMPMFFELDGVGCKILPDMLRIDHTRKKILTIDFKTMGDYVLRFSLAMRIRRYDLQGSFYHRGTKANLEEISKLIGKDVTKYTLSNPAFIVESTIKWGTPMVYVMTDDLMDIGIKGDDKYILGYIQGIELYKNWKAIDYSLDDRFKHTNGIVWIDSRFEYNEVF